MGLRIASTVLLLFSVIFAPFWVSVVLSLAAIAYFRFYGESAVLFFLSDLLYGTAEARFYSITYLSVAVALIIIFLAEFLKKKLKFYPKYEY